MEFSLPGLIGAVIGTVVGVLNYVFFVGVVERALRERDTSQTDAERATFESKIWLMRRLVLATDIVLFGGLGCWLGMTIAG